MPLLTGVDPRTPLKAAGPPERLTVDATSGGVALASVPAGCTLALIRVLSNPIAFTDDGATAPTSSVGMELEAGDLLWYNGPLTKIKAIRTTGSSGTLVVNYYTIA